jgi:hypothetical protein
MLAKQRGQMHSADQASSMVAIDTVCWAVSLDTETLPLHQYRLLPTRQVMLFHLPRITECLGEALAVHDLSFLRSMPSIQTGEKPGVMI